MLVRLFDGAIEDLPVGIEHGGGRNTLQLDHRQARGPHRCAHDLHRHGARNFTGCVAAHAVGDDVDAAIRGGFGEIRVLVSGPDHSHVRVRGVNQLHVTAAWGIES